MCKFSNFRIFGLTWPSGAAWTCPCSPCCSCSTSCTTRTLSPPPWSFSPTPYISMVSIPIRIWVGILERHFSSRFLGINSSLLRLEFLYVFFYPHFPFYKMLFVNRLEFSCLADFLARIFKTREEYGFLSNSPVDWTVKSMAAKDSSLSLNLCPRIPSLGPQHWLFAELTQKVVQYVNGKSLGVHICLKCGNNFMWKLHVSWLFLRRMFYKYPFLFNSKVPGTSTRYSKFSHCWLLAGLFIVVRNTRTFKLAYRYLW